MGGKRSRRPPQRPLFPPLPRPHLQIELVADGDDDGVRLPGQPVHVLDGDSVDLVVGVQAPDVFPEKGRNGVDSAVGDVAERGAREGQPADGHQGRHATHSKSARRDENGTHSAAGKGLKRCHPRPAGSAALPEGQGKTYRLPSITSMT
jgi:hypothetical protein